MRLRRNKFGVASKADRTVDGFTFASLREATRYSELRLLAKAGKIEDFEWNPIHLRYRIVVSNVHICDYLPDFRYRENGKLVLEDAKGVRTPVYKLKKKLMLAVHGIQIRET